MVESVAIVGAGLAGLRCAEALRLAGFEGRVTLIGDERHQPYDRPPLSKQVLAGTWPVERTTLPAMPDLDVEWALGGAVASVHLGDRTLELDDGTTIPFDGLVVATGSAARSLPGPARLGGVFTLRTLDDCQEIAAALDSARRVAVVGGGFIGSEVASTAHERGLDTVVIEAAPAPLTRVLGTEVGTALGQLHTRNGVELRCDATVADLVDRNGRVTGVRLGDGSTIDADVVVVGIGGVPNTDWLEGSGIAMRDGVCCDEWCRALDEHGAVIPGVVAAGDVARWEHRLAGRSVRLEHWTNAVEQSEAAATALLADDASLLPPFSPVPYVWSDQYGSKIQYVGWSLPDDQVSVVAGSLDEEKFLAVYSRDGRATGAVALNMPAKVFGWQDRIANGELIDD